MVGVADLIMSMILSKRFHNGNIILVAMCHDFVSSHKVLRRGCGGTISMAKYPLSSVLV